MRWRTRAARGRPARAARACRRGRRCPRSARRTPPVASTIPRQPRGPDIASGRSRPPADAPSPRPSLRRTACVERSQTDTAGRGWRRRGAGRPSAPRAALCRGSWHPPDAMRRRPSRKRPRWFPSCPQAVRPFRGRYTIPGHAPQDYRERLSWSVHAPRSQASSACRERDTAHAARQHADLLSTVPRSVAAGRMPPGSR